MQLLTIAIIIHFSVQTIRPLRKQQMMNRITEQHAILRTFEVGSPVELAQITYLKPPVAPTALTIPNNKPISNFADSRKSSLKHSESSKNQLVGDEQFF